MISTFNDVRKKRFQAVRYVSCFHLRDRFDFLYSIRLSVSVKKPHTMSRTVPNAYVSTTDLIRSESILIKRNFKTKCLRIQLFAKMDYPD